MTIIGGGLSGLAAAIAVVRAGGQAHVHERRREIGARFHGDFQGLENWSTDADVLSELQSLGIETTFDHTPFTECVVFDPDGREYLCRSRTPLWYLVRRGPGAGSLDQALKAQALAVGVHIECDTTLEHLPNGGILAHGPRRVDAIAVGYVFPTDRSDGAYAVASDALAPGGYGYLLVHGGRATLATCMFRDFHNDRHYLARTTEFFTRAVGITVRDARQFGGYGNFAAVPVWRRRRMLFTGEAAQLQDALLGFGMRSAIVSGCLAGWSVLADDGSSYASACERRFGAFVRAAVVNRYVYGHCGAPGYRLLIRSLASAGDPRAWARRCYGGGWWTRMLYPFARRGLARRLTAPLPCPDDCDCTYCRCVRHAARASGNERPGHHAERLDPACA